MIIDLDNQFKKLNSNGLNLNSSKVALCVNNIIKNEGYVKYSVDEEIFATDGGNYLGVLCQVTVKGQTDKEEKENNLFIKIITPGEEMTMICLPDAYKKERYVYLELSKIFSELQDEANVPLQERYNLVKIYEESTEDVIVLENMCKKGYKTCDRMNVISIQFAEHAIKSLARFHALSFVLQAKRPNYFESNIKPMKQPVVLTEDTAKFIQNVYSLTINNLEDNNRRIFLAALSSFQKKFIELNSKKCGNDVLCHGDYRANNVLIKEHDGTITDVIPIDFQLIFYGCPVLDFCYFIFPATDREFRRLHLNNLKDLYHETLGTFLEYFNLDVKEIYPREDFEAQYKERLLYGLMCSVNILPLILAKQGDKPDITKGDIGNLNIEVDDTFKGRINGIVEDFIDWGYL